MKAMYGVILMVGALATTGCRIHARGWYEPPPPATVTVTAGTPPPPSASVQVVGGAQMGAGVTVVEATCVQGGQEQCNGIDDNCNGAVDEGCGYQTGAIQITSAWNTGADIDMYVTDPSGETLSYSHTNSSSGGVLDHDARGQCTGQTANNTIENVYWNSPQPPHGTYSVALHYYSDCNVGAGATPTTVSIAVGGRVIGAYQIVLQPNQGANHVTVATFTI